MAGGIVSLVIMYLLHRIGKFSIVAVSITGGVSHNLAQLIVAACVVENTSILYYLPVLIVAGVVTGLLIGILSLELMKPLSRLVGRSNKT